MSKKSLLIVLFLLSFTVVTSLFFIRSYYINKGEKFFTAINITKAFPEQKLILLDRYGEKFFEKQISYAGGIKYEEVDEYLDRYLKLNCYFSGGSYLFQKFFFISSEQINNIYAGCLDIDFNNELERYGFYKYLISNVNPRKIASIILSNRPITKNINGINGLSIYLFNKSYHELNSNEKVYIIYIMNNVSRLQVKDKDDFLHFKEEYFPEISNDEIRFYKDRVSIDLYPHISKMILKDFEGFDLEKDKDYIIKTSFDPFLYQNVLDIVGGYFEKRDKNLQTAGIIVDYKKGDILTSFGSKDGKGRLNRVIDIKRQVGSIFKPIVYLTAFDNGISPNDIIEDKPTIYGKGPKAYAPKNFEDFYMGKTKVENALIYSLNNGTLQVALKVGLEKVSDMASRLGMTTPVGLGYCLGSGEYTVLDVANYFSVIANEGVRKRNSYIKELVFDNNSVFRESYSPDEVVVSRETVGIVKNILAKVVKIGTARGARLLPGTIGKTGTTNDSRDAWFAAIYDRYVIVVWVGRDDYRPMADNGTGGGVAAPLVAKIQRVIK